jgi:hypothetical protein
VTDAEGTKFEVVEDVEELAELEAEGAAAEFAVELDVAGCDGAVPCPPLSVAATEVTVPLVGESGGVAKGAIATTDTPRRKARAAPMWADIEAALTSDATAPLQACAIAAEEPNLNAVFNAEYRAKSELKRP